MNTETSSYVPKPDDVICWNFAGYHDTIALVIRQLAGYGYIIRCLPNDDHRDDLIDDDGTMIVCAEIQEMTYIGEL